MLAADQAFFQPERKGPIPSFRQGAAAGPDARAWAAEQPGAAGRGEHARHRPDAAPAQKSEGGPGRCSCGPARATQGARPEARCSGFEAQSVVGSCEACRGLPLAERVTTSRCRQ